MWFLGESGALLEIKSVHAALESVVDLDVMERNRMHVVDWR